MFRFDDNSLVFTGWERGIAEAPYEGLTDMRNVDITTTPGEVSVSFASEAVTLPPIFNLESFTGTASSDTITISDTTGLYEGCAVAINSFSGTGLNTGDTAAVDISYVIAAGGGAGGNAKGTATNGTGAGGGGGAGEVLSGTTTLGLGTYAITVGDGGVAAATTGTANGGNGENSEIDTIGTANGGSGGGSGGGLSGAEFANNGTNSLGGDAGAGGGGAMSGSATLAGTGGTGTFNGGNGSASTGSSGGGGSSQTEAGSAGSNDDGGAGADGVSVSINGYSANLAGAGAGGGANSGGSPTTAAPGGLGGGGNGGTNNNGTYSAPTAGQANTGSGGGGSASESGTSRQGANGGSGIVVITYLTGSMVATGGTITTSGSYTVHTFTADDEFIVTSVGNPSLYYVRNLTATTFQLSEYPNSDIVDITGDGTGTFTTYQYGNQRGLDNNGSPVSYFEAPEMGGVLLADLSNYVWLWQQGDDGASPQNTLLFLGNTAGIATSSTNQTGVAYWKGYVCLVQQPTTIDLLNWEDFSSTVGSAWVYNGLDQYLTITATETIDSSANMVSNLVRLDPVTATSRPEIIDSGSDFTAASSTTVVSSSITLEDGDILIAFCGNYDATSTLSGVTFNASAMTFIDGASTTGVMLSAYSYQASATVTATITATFNAVQVNKRILYVVVRNSTLTGIAGFSATASSSTGISDTVLLQKSNQIIITAALGKNTSGTMVISSPFTQELSSSNSSGSFGIGYMVGQGQAATLKKSVPISVGDNNILYWGSGDQYVGSLQADPNFNPSQSVNVTNQVVTSGLTYNLNGQALDLPANERVESLSMDGGKLYVGATSNKLYPWDTISPSFDYPIEFPEYGLCNSITANNTVYVLGGNLGRIYQTNGASAAMYKEIPEDVTESSKPLYFFWDVNKGNGELYFSFEAYPNGSTTPVDTVGGAWAINANTGALRLVQAPLQGYDVLTRMVCPVGHGESQTFLRPPGLGILMGYTDGSSHYLDYSVSTPYTDYSPYVITDVVPVGTYFAQQTFEHIEYKLAAPMVTGESIRVSQRSNLSDTFTTIAEFTTIGLISDQSSINWENVEWVQFRVELRSTATNPSFTRLRELRLR